MTAGDHWRALLPSLPAEQATRLEAYAGELLSWNRSVRLLGPKDMAGIRIQIADSLLPYLSHPPPSPLLDLGSGAGLPGIPLAVAFPTLQVTCAEPRTKRVSFLRHVVRCLELPRVQVLAARIGEESAPALAGSFGAVTARAVGDVSSLLRLAGPLLEPHGLVFLPRGGQEELLPLPPGWISVVDQVYRAPGGLGPRRLLVCRRAA